MDECECFKKHHYVQQTEIKILNFKWESETGSSRVFEGVRN